MQFKTIDEQVRQAIFILENNKDLMNILDYIYELKMPNFYIAAGSIFQTIWNYYDNRPLNYGIKDIDIVYYDKKNLSREKEDELENKIKNHFKKINLQYEIDIHNEARMHLWKKENENQNIDHYKNSEDAIDQWVATIQAIGITKVNNQIKIYAPYGLSDVFNY